MRLRFSEVKATQAAARLLMLRGGRMSYLKLIKLLYLVDREGLLRWGRPVTTDSYVSMDHGPVVSRIYDLIREEPAPESEGFWRKHISEPANYEVQLLQDPGNSELSRAEERLLGEVFERHGHKTRWELRDFSHRLPEWTDPAGSTIPISLRDILKAEHRTEAEVASLEAEIESLAFAEAVASPE